MPIQRLDKTLSGSGLFTRSEAAALVKSGRVAVDGFKALSGDEKYDPGAVLITIDGKPLEYRRYRYIVLNKPAGYVSATEDKREKTVMELIGEEYSALGLFPAGRLDKDAEGLLLLTNDGELSHEITSPGKKVDKRYFVQTDSAVTSEDVEAFENGLVLGDGTRCLPAGLEPAPGGAIVTLREGKYHQVKRMMAALGKPAKYLKRIAIGGLTLDADLEPGEYNELSADNVRSLIFATQNRK